MLQTTILCSYVNTNFKCEFHTLLNSGRILLLHKFPSLIGCHRLVNKVIRWDKIDLKSTLLIRNISGVVVCMSDIRQMLLIRKLKLYVVLSSQWKKQIKLRDTRRDLISYYINWGDSQLEHQMCHILNCDMEAIK